MFDVSLLLPSHQNKMPQDATTHHPTPFHIPPKYNVQYQDPQPALDNGNEDNEGENIPDNKTIMVMNVEGYRKLNAYAHSVNPITAGATSASAPAPAFESSEQQTSQKLPQQPLHPTLVSLSEVIRTSARKMEHVVLDRAATACQRFGGRSTVFYKSGKDRTAMQVTFKQAQSVQ